MSILTNKRTSGTLGRLLLVSFVGVFMLASSAVAQQSRLSEKAQSAVMARKASKVDVIVLYRDPPKAAEKGRIQALGGVTNRTYSHIPVLALSVPAQALRGLAKGNGVRYVALDSEVTGFSTSAKATANLPAYGSSSYVTAQNDVGIAVVDSGVGDHSDIYVAGRVDCTLASQMVNQTVRDEFASQSFGGNDGTVSWIGSWQELGDSGGATSGRVRVDTNDWRCTDSSNCLRIGGGEVTLSNRGVVREANLQGASSVNLTLRSRRG